MDSSGRVVRKLLATASGAVTHPTARPRPDVRVMLQVGVCTATFTRQGTGRSSGVNLAIPIDTVSATIPKLIVKATSVA